MTIGSARMVNNMAAQNLNPAQEQPQQGGGILPLVVAGGVALGIGGGAIGAGVGVGALTQLPFHPNAQDLIVTYASIRDTKDSFLDEFKKTKLQQAKDGMIAISADDARLLGHGTEATNISKECLENLVSTHKAETLAHKFSLHELKSDLIKEVFEKTDEAKALGAAAGRAGGVVNEELFNEAHQLAKTQNNKKTQTLLRAIEMVEESKAKGIQNMPEAIAKAATEIATAKGKPVPAANEAMKPIYEAMASARRSLRTMHISQGAIMGGLAVPAAFCAYMAYRFFAPSGKATQPTQA